MSFIPINITYTDQSDFENPTVTSLDVDTSTFPGSVVLAKTNTENTQIFNSNNNFDGSLSSDLIISGSSVTIKPFLSRLMNIVPQRTTTTNEDYLSLPYSPIEANSLVIKVDGYNIVDGIDYVVNLTSGRVDLSTRFSSTSNFEASYLSEGILACEGILETNPIHIGFEATQVQLDLTGINLNTVSINQKISSTVTGLTSESWVPVSGNIITLDSSDRVLKLQFIFVPSDYTTTTFPVTFKYAEDWNLAGSVFNQTVLDSSQKIEIASVDNTITNLNPLPVPTTLAGIDYFQDSLSNDLYLIEAGGYESPTSPSASVRIAKIKPDHSIEAWQNVLSLPAPSVPFNGLKVINIDGTNYVYTLNNNNSTDLYKSTASQGGLTTWNIQQPLPVKLNRANLEIITDSSNNSYILVQNNEVLYWVQINNATGNVKGNWKSFKLPERQQAAATAISRDSTQPNTWYLYVLGGVIGNEIQKATTKLITKVTVTSDGNSLNFTAQELNTQLPNPLAYFTAEFIDINTTDFLYIFGGTSATDAFSDASYNNIYRIPVDLTNGSLTGTFTDSPNKLFTASSGLNTVVIPENGTLCTYVVGDTSRASSRISCINIVPDNSILRVGSFTTGIFEVPGCDIQYSTLMWDSLLRNNNQSVIASYRAADSEDNLLASSFTSISNNGNIVANSESKFIQFKFDLAKDPNGSVTELSPILNSFTFVFTSNISSLVATPSLSEFDLTFDNFLYDITGEIIFRYDSENSQTEYTNLVVNWVTPVADENVDVSYRTGNSFPITDSFQNISNFFLNPPTARFIEVRAIPNASTDQIFSPVITDVIINGIQPQNVSDSVSQFVFHELPTGAQDQLNMHYVTASQFEPGSLQVFVNGVEQLPDLIYTPGVDNQSFDFISYAPDDLDVIFVNYIKPL